MRWLSPLSLIFAVSLLYFAAPLHGGDFTLQFNQQVNGHIRELALGPDDKRLTPEQAQASGQFHSRFTTAWLQRRVSERDAALRSASAGATGYSYRDYRLAYDAKADDVSKALILLHLPFAACVLMVLFYRQRRYFAEHIVFLTHYVAFYIIVQVIDDALYRLVIAEKWPVPDDVFNWATRAVLIVYATLAIRRAYGVGFVAASAAAAVMLATLIFVNLYIFRAIQFAVTFALT